MTEQTPKLDVQTLEYVRHLIRREAEMYERMVDIREKTYKFDEADEFDERRKAMRCFERDVLDYLIRKQQGA